MISSRDLFHCTQCGECCRGYGGTFLTREDIGKISDFLGMDAASFEKRFCRYSGGKPLLAQNKDGFCVLFDQLCTIHSVKPRMCRAWPFIHSILVDVKNWHSMADSCPGMRTDVDDEDIKACVARELERQAGQPNS